MVTCRLTTQVLRWSAPDHRRPRRQWDPDVRSPGQEPSHPRRRARSKLSPRRRGRSGSSRLRRDLRTFVAGQRWVASVPLRSSTWRGSDCRRGSAMLGIGLQGTSAYSSSGSRKAGAHGSGEARRRARHRCRPRSRSGSSRIALFLVGGAILLTPHERAAYWLRDLTVYRTALATCAAGSDPYRVGPARPRPVLHRSAVRLGALQAGGGELVPALRRTCPRRRRLRLVGGHSAAAGRLLRPVARSGWRSGRRSFLTAFAGAGFFAAMATNNERRFMPWITVRCSCGVTRTDGFSSTPPSRSPPRSSPSTRPSGSYRCCRTEASWAPWPPWPPRR